MENEILSLHLKWLKSMHLGGPGEHDWQEEAVLQLADIFKQHGVI